MSHVIKTLCAELKKIAHQLKQQNHPLSLLLLVGKSNQGKSTLLQQSNFKSVRLDNEDAMTIYYNDQGIIIEMCESWSNQPLQVQKQAFKQINRCHRTLKVSGIILTVNTNQFLAANPQEIIENCKSHARLLQKYSAALGYPIKTALFFTQVDTFAGFCDFFEHEHETKLQKPFGFSLEGNTQKTRLISSYKTQFDQFIEKLNQQVINKIHPVRSSAKRTLIREFPLQLISLRTAIQALIQYLPIQNLPIQAIYFVSSLQGGTSQDRLNKKIKNEYALVVSDHYPQSNNYRPYFINGAFNAFQNHCPIQINRLQPIHKWGIASLSAVSALICVSFLHQQLYTAKILDDASKELLIYDNLSQKSNDSAPALYHLAKASRNLEKLRAHTAVSSLQQLKTHIQTNTAQHLQTEFIPMVLHTVERPMLDPHEPPARRHQALKIYLMLAQPDKFIQEEFLKWFKIQWALTASPDQLEKLISLLTDTFRQPFQPVSVNHQIILETRNYLNALPTSYLYYSLAKAHFPQEHAPIEFEGFVTPHKSLPVYYTKQGFEAVQTMLPEISKTLDFESWVLARQQNNQTQSIIEQAYYYDYITWWENFTHRTVPLHFNDFQQGQALAHRLIESNAIERLTTFIQENTSPDYNDPVSVFNRVIANKFTSINLISHGSLNALSVQLEELGKFMNMMAIIKDGGRTAFSMVKMKYQSNDLTNPLSSLDEKTEHLPAPVRNWFKQIANESWFILFQDTKYFINQQWQANVYDFYKSNIEQKYPFHNAVQEVRLPDFENFFGRYGVLNQFIESYIKPFLDTSTARWEPKKINEFVMPISSHSIDAFIRANVITNMFFPTTSSHSQIVFSLQKINLDPIIDNLKLDIGQTSIQDTQDSDSFERFHWPQDYVKLSVNSIEGHHYELEESGPWAFFKMLQKVNVFVDEKDSSTLQILFEINGNSGRYILQTQNKVNPFIPGILDGFNLRDNVF